LIELGIIVTINGLHILQLSEFTERISQTHQFLNGNIVFDAFNHVDDVINLVALEHHHHELVQRVRSLSNDVLKFSEKLLFHGASEKLNVHLGGFRRLVFKDTG
jgi:hypothetical protein